MRNPEANWELLCFMTLRVFHVSHDAGQLVLCQLAKVPYLRMEADLESL
jgi:hypothetical protein